VDSWRIRYLFLLGLIVACADLCEQFATAALAGAQLAVPWDIRLIYILSSVGPFLVFAVIGTVAFRRFNLSLWWLTICATAYALLTVLGLLMEYGMARAVVESHYMNCAGSPRVYLIILATPLTFVVLVASGILVAFEVTIRWLARQYVSGLGKT